MISFYLNDKKIETALPKGATVLDFIRKHQQLTGTKIGCREGDCGACTILVGKLVNGQLSYQSMTSCLMPLINAHGKHIATVEGINGQHLTPVQQAIVEQGGTQCGFCTIGFVISLTGFALTDKGNEKAIASIDGNICRCTGYKSIERAADEIAEKISQKPEKNTLDWLVKHEFIPGYFLNIKEGLEVISIKTTSEIPNEENIVGGGTDLYVQKPEEMTKRELDAFLDRDPLKGISVREGNCYLGASVTVTEIEHSDIMQQIFPSLKQHIKLVSSTPIRNMATIAGNFVNASPIGDMTIFFLALDSSIVLKDKENRRTIKLKDFYKGYKQLDKTNKEIIESVFFEIPQGNYLFNFEKVSKRTHLDIATVNSACLLKTDNQNNITDIHLSAGGLAAIPKYLDKTSEFLKGKRIDESILSEAVQVLQSEVSPISDIRGSKAYKRLLLRQLFYAHLLQITPDLSIQKTGL